jgi:hypothetical protein
MKSIACALALLALAVAVKPAHASGPVSVYALIDRVVMEPNPQKPERIRIYGVFITAQPPPYNYGAPRRGFLLFSLGRDPDQAKKEWADLESVAGTRQVVGFGAAWLSAPQIRDASDNSKYGDDYLLNAGVVKVNPDHPQAKALLASH